MNSVIRTPGSANLDAPPIFTEPLQIDRANHGNNRLLLETNE